MIRKFISLHWTDRFSAR